MGVCAGKTDRQRRSIRWPRFAPRVQARNSEAQSPKVLHATVIALRPEVGGVVCKVLSLAVAVPNLAISRLWASRAAFKGLRTMPRVSRMQQKRFGPVFQGLACRARHPCAWKF